MRFGEKYATWQTAPTVSTHFSSFPFSRLSLVIRGHSPVTPSLAQAHLPSLSLSLLPISYQPHHCRLLLSLPLSFSLSFHALVPVLPLPFRDPILSILLITPVLQPSFLLLHLPMHPTPSALVYPVSSLLLSSSFPLISAAASSPFLTICAR